MAKQVIIENQLEALNHLIAHQNAAIDLLASDKRAELVTDVATIAELARNGELLEVMDYGDEIHPEWVDGETHYNPAMNLCHESDEELEDGETIHGCFFEWDKTLPFGVQFSHQRAFTAVAHKVASNLTSGTTYYWQRQSDGKYISFKAPAAISAGQWLGYQNGMIEVYDTSGQLTNAVTATVGTSAPSGTSLGDTPVMAAGDYYFTFESNWGNNVVAGAAVSFTLASALQFGDRLCGCYGAPDQARTNWKIYPVTDDGKTIGDALAVGTDTTGTNLGVLGLTARSTTGSYFLGRTQEMAYGYNRWKYSALRQFLNSSAAVNAWWTAQDIFDVRPDQLSQKPGFLAGYSEETIRFFKPVKIVTVACNADSNVEDVTYDRVFLSSLEQMYCVPQFSGKEGSYWEYYKRLTGRTEPMPTAVTYPRLIKYALNAPTSAQYCWRRSANRNYAYYAWLVTASGLVYTTYAHYAFRCAPSVFISD